MGEREQKPVTGQSARQVARRAALDAQAKLRKDRVQRERRLSARGVDVMVALGERDETVRRAEQRAGEALRKMTADDGLSLDEVVQWCGVGLTRREAARLCSLAQASTAEPVPGAIDGAGA